MKKVIVIFIFLFGVIFAQNVKLGMFGNMQMNSDDDSAFIDLCVEKTMTENGWISSEDYLKLPPSAEPTLWIIDTVSGSWQPIQFKGPFKLGSKSQEHDPFEMTLWQECAVLYMRQGLVSLDKSKDNEAQKAKAYEDMRKLKK